MSDDPRACDVLSYFFAMPAEICELFLLAKEVDESASRLHAARAIAPFRGRDDMLRERAPQSDQSLSSESSKSVERRFPILSFRLAETPE